MRKILLHNVGYFRGMNGSAMDAIRKWHRLFYVTRGAQKKAIAELGFVVEREKPDAAVIIEVNRGSLDNGFLNQAAAVGAWFHGGKDVEKYHPDSGHSFWWFLSGKGNACFANESAAFEHFYLKDGMKRLVIVTRLQGLTLYAVHLATMNPRTRALQLSELAEHVSKESGPVVICGDFNIFAGMSELEPLVRLGFTPTSEEKTFSAAHPFFALDLFLVSPELAGRVRSRVLTDVLFSDHLPAIIEIDG
jgi:hypothetical protein